MDDLRLLGVDSEFLAAIGEEPEQFSLELLNNPQIQAQYTKDAIQSFFTPSYEPLPISCELEHMLGIPPIPVGVSELDTLRLYYAARQFKYKYKLMKLIGFITPDDLTTSSKDAIRFQMADFNHTRCKYYSATTVAAVLLGHMVFRLHFIMDYPFLNKQELENTTIPYESRRY